MRVSVGHRLVNLATTLAFVMATIWPSYSFATQLDALTQRVSQGPRLKMAEEDPSRTPLPGPISAVFAPTDAASKDLKHYYQLLHHLWQQIDQRPIIASSFEEAYRPTAWSKSSQLALNFGLEDQASSLILPAQKNFVSHAGATWLQIVYGHLGWFFDFDEKAGLSIRYKPEGSKNLVTVLLATDGNLHVQEVRLKSATVFSDKAIQLDLSADGRQPDSLLVAAPLVQNFGAVETTHLGVYAQKHINFGRYALEKLTVSAQDALNKGSMNIGESFLASGEHWKNEGKIEGAGFGQLHLKGTLDNTGGRIDLKGGVQGTAKQLYNRKGYIGGESLTTCGLEVLDNVDGILESKTVYQPEVERLKNTNGIIRSYQGVDFEKVGFVEVGGIDTPGDVTLRLGHFSLTDDAVIGNTLTPGQGRINRLVIKPDGPIADLSPLELKGVIKAIQHKAYVPTVFGPNVYVERLSANRGARITSRPGQFQAFQGYLQDNPLSPKHIRKLKFLEWVLLSGEDVLPYDMETEAKVVLREAPGAIIGHWPVSKDLHAARGIKVEMKSAQVEMGDAKGETYPEWQTDRGPLEMRVGGFDQKSGLLAALSGGFLRTIGKLKLGEACGSTTKRSLWSGTKAEVYGVSEKKSAVFSTQAPFQLESETEDIVTLFAHIDGTSLTWTTRPDKELFFFPVYWRDLDSGRLIAVAFS